MRGGLLITGLFPFQLACSAPSSLGTYRMIGTSACRGRVQMNQAWFSFGASGSPSLRSNQTIRSSSTILAVKSGLSANRCRRDRNKIETERQQQRQQSTAASINVMQSRLDEAFRQPVRALTGIGVGRIGDDARIEPLQFRILAAM